MSLPGFVPPIKCQHDGCTKYAHHHCANMWVEDHGLPEADTIATLCRQHHPSYIFPVQPPITSPNLAVQPTTTSPATMVVGSVSKKTKGRSPIESTANKVNNITTKKQKMNKSGELVAGISKGPKIYPNGRVYTYQRDLRYIVKQGDPQYHIICKFEGKFRFYGKVVRSDKKKGFWQIEYDLLPSDANVLVLKRDACHTLPRGSDEPEYDRAKEDFNEFVNVFGDISDSEPDSDCELALPDELEDGLDEFGDGEKGEKSKSKPGKKKESRKVRCVREFLQQDDDWVKEATVFDHYYGEKDEDFIRWTILKEGEEITHDVMQHPDKIDPFLIDIPWWATTERNDYFGIFFQHFFPSLEGKADLLDKFLDDPRASYHKTVIKENIRFHRPKHVDPDYIVS